MLDPERTYLICRMERGIPVIHVMWTGSIDGLQVSEFVPDERKSGWRFAVWPFVAWWFKGHIREGPGEHTSTLARFYGVRPPIKRAALMILSPLLTVVRWALMVIVTFSITVMITLLGVLFWVTHFVYMMGQPPRTRRSG